jgi:hypothetical protein
VRVDRGLALVCAVTVATAIACNQPREIRPDALDDARLDSVMSCDLNTYFSKRAGVPVTVEHLYLRRGPTVTGIAYPKYYVWIRERDSPGYGTTVEGAARVALIGSVIEVTHFFPRDYIADNPGSIDSVFPPAVVVEIRKRLLNVPTRPGAGISRRSGSSRNAA